jgi:hypothetical protein
VVCGDSNGEERVGVCGDRDDRVGVCGDSDGEERVGVCGGENGVGDVELR